ncbi:hypothetical protein F7725_004609 [Dissostichus mawsoni]|uniref:RING-type domain-containing protein n=1 Tax=Dissostichus mawsoni TaxID=36200 RepID=A0A7J5XJ93_DISMA|nr:hypothetical protein F7725_004609 [Dissostichus mawsoni]
MAYFEEKMARLAATEYCEFKTCLKEWKGAAPGSDRCNNDGCINAVLELLKNCKTTAPLRYRGSLRVPPSGPVPPVHDTTGCKNIICPRCQWSSALCLKLTPECLQTSSYFLPCSAGVAPDKPPYLTITMSMRDRSRWRSGTTPGHHLKFVKRKDDLDPVCDEDDGQSRDVLRPRRHPDSLTQWCRSQLDDGYYKFRCPAVGEGTTQCNKLCRTKRTSVERKDLSNLCVQCSICTADLKKTYHFCWQCMRKWTGPGPRSDCCDNDGCMNGTSSSCRPQDPQPARGGGGRRLPSVEHSQQYCKNIDCPRCHVAFCFVCLKLKSECCKTSSPYKICPSGVAPRQAAIPSMRGQEQVEKRYDPRDTTLKFVKRKDDLDPVCDEDDGLRAEMSCGHAVPRLPHTMGYYKFRCPAVGEGTTQCNKLWSYQEVRRLADLSVEEMQYFEEAMSLLAAAEYSDLKKTYQFCWQCMKEWTGLHERDLQLLQTCKTLSLPAVEGVADCPSVRVCPTCGMKVEHSQQYCKNIDCPRCHVVFCFVCLKLKSECCKTSSPYKICPSGVAPRQAAIPVSCFTRRMDFVVTSMAGNLAL